MKKILLLCLFFTSYICFAKPDSKEPRFFLVPNYIYIPGKENVLRIYESPSKEGTVVSRVNLQLNKDSRSMLLFDEGKAVQYNMIITSSEKVGSFYRVYYKGSYFWVYEEDLGNVLTYNEYFEDLKWEIGVRFDSRMPLFKSINGEKVPWDVIAKFRNSKNRKLALDIPVTKATVVDDKLWLKLEIGKKIPADREGVLELDEPIVVWVRAYNDEGRMSKWGYSHLHIFPIRPELRERQKQYNYSKNKNKNKK